jgi:hypothetical protein
MPDDNNRPGQFLICDVRIDELLDLIKLRRIHSD